MILKKNALFLILAVALVSGCDKPVEVTTTPCDQLGKTTDPELKEKLKKQCGHGGAEFKPTPKTKTY